MILLKKMDKKTIDKLNYDFSRRVESGNVKQMKLGNKGKEVPFSVESFRKAAELALKI